MPTVFILKLEYTYKQCKDLELPRIKKILHLEWASKNYFPRKIKDY